MATFNVFVEGAVDDSPMGLPELAETMSERYGLPATELVSRLKRGRFRVKSKLDRATAERYQADLESIGARVVIEDSEISPTATPYAGVQTTPTPPRGASMSLPPLDVRQHPAAPRVPRGRDLGPAGKSTTEPPPITRYTPASGLGPAGSTEPPPSRTAEPHPNIPTVPSNPTLTSIVELPVRAAIEARPSGITAPPATSRSQDPAPASPPSRTNLPPTPATGRSTPTTGLAAAGVRPTPPKGVRPATSPVAGRPATPPGRAATGLDAAGPAPVARAVSQGMASGLSAAFSQDVATPTNLGALGANDALSLGSLDDGDPSPVEVKVTISSPVKSADARPPERPKPAAAASSLDLFAPPDAEEAEQRVDLATDEVDERARKRESAPPEAKPAAPPSTNPLMPKTSRPQPQGGVSLSERAPMPKPRFIAGVALSVVLAFVPVHFIAAMREASAFEAIDLRVEQTQASADTPETYAALDGFRARQLEAKEGKQRSIALTSMLLWALFAAGVAFVWFRKIPWDDLGKRAPG